jgi:hypothetical protein
MMRISSLLALGAIVVGLLACGGRVVVDPGPGGSGGASAGSTTSTISSTSAGGGGGCPAGTCHLGPDGACEAPTGPKGNGCCQCGSDGLCAAFCDCASPDTPIATPAGEQAIASLRAGDLVYSVQGMQVVAVPILATHQIAVAATHRVVRVRLATGATLEISRGHPTLDGRTFGELRPGGQLGGVEILGVETVSYAYDRTYDILPGSDSGGYFAGGALVGSTLKPAARVQR